MPNYRDAWLAQLEEHVTLNLRSCEFKPHTGHLKKKKSPIIVL